MGDAAQVLEAPEVELGSSVRTRPRSAEVLRELSELLGEERAAALRADVDALESIQPRKQALIDRARDEEFLERPSFRCLAEMARSNVALIQRLVVYYRALAGEEQGARYGADGKSSSGPPVVHARGVL